MKALKPLDLDMKLKPLDSAVHSVDILPGGTFVMSITHDIIKGVTPTMLEWWFRNIEGDMDYRGKSYNRYRVWHPVDHIRWKLVKRVNTSSGVVGVGSYFQIVEAFGGNPNYMINVTERVDKLDATGIRLVNEKAGQVFSSLEHKFVRVTQGTQYISRLQVGSETILGKYFFNNMIRPFLFTKTMCMKWIKHNVEEVGNFENFLPELYYRTNHLNRNENGA